MKTSIKSIVLVQLFVLCLNSAAFSQNRQVKLSSIFGGANEDVAKDIAVTSDKGYIIVGDTKSLLPGFHLGYDIYVVKLDIKGDTIWTRCLGGNDTDKAIGVEETDDKGYLIAGYTYSADGDVEENHGLYDYWLVKLNSNGDKLWTKNYGGSSYDVLRGLNKTSDGGFILAGKTSSSNGDISGKNGLEDFWIVRLNSEGDTMWTKCFGGSKYEEAFAITETSDNGFITVGYTNSFDGDVSGPHGEADYWALKLSNTGELLWANCYGGSSYEYAWAVEEIPADTGYIVAGYSRSIDGDVHGNHGNNDFWLLMLNSSGDTIWTRSLGGSGTDEAKSIQFDSDTTFIVAGTTSSIDGDVTNNKGGRDYWIVKLNLLGDTLWTKCLGGTSNDYALAADLRSNNNIVIAGKSTSVDMDVPSNRGGYDYWMVEYGCDDFSLIYDSTICEGDSIFFRGLYYKTSGYYYDTLTNQVGCDSILTIKVDVIPKIYPVEIGICEGQSYYAQGEDQTISGVYYDTLSHENGCDSILVTTLTVFSPIKNTIDTTICEGQSYFTEGSDQTISGVYYDTLSTVHGCDSIIETILTFTPPEKQTIDTTICEGQSFFAQGDDQVITGVYYDTLSTEHGCDSIIETILTVYPLEKITIDTTICEGQSYYAQGDDQSNSGIYYDTLETVNGCDSIIETILTVAHTEKISIDTSICEGETYFTEGKWQTSSGLYYDTLITVNNCDSIIQTFLIVNPTLKNITYVTICEGEVHYTEGADQSDPGIYYDTIANSEGCDSTKITVLNVEACQSGNELVKENAIDLFPNPVQGILNINMDDLYQLQLYDCRGNLVLQTNKPRVDFSGYDHGIFYIKLIDSKGKSFTRKVIHNE